MKKLVLLGLALGAAYWMKNHNLFEELSASKNSEKKSKGSAPRENPATEMSI